MHQDQGKAAVLWNDHIQGYGLGKGPVLSSIT